MADIHFEIFDNADFGNKNLRFSEAPAKEQRDFLKQNGYGFTTRYGGVWYPRTQEAKDRNSDFVKEFAEKFYPENYKKPQPNQIEQLAELENGSAEIKTSADDRIAYLENLVAELQEERKRDQEKITRLEAALENQDEENSAELEMQKEQAELDDEAEWEKENTLTEEEEKAYLEKQSEINIPAETIEISPEMMNSLHEAAEKESRADEPQAEKEILHDSEKSDDDDLTVSPQELAVAKSVLPSVQYVSTLKFAQGEEREFFVHKIKEIAIAVENAPKINETDGLEEHRIVLRYFHPSGTQSFVTEIGKDGDAFGFQCLNDDWENAEWGYLNLDELKNIRGMEVDFHVPAGMTVEKFIQKEKAEQHSAEDIDESLKLMDLEKEENHGKTISEFSASEVSRLSEEKYGFYFEYSDDENVADIYSAKDGDFVGSYGAGGFGYADDLSGNDPTTKIPDENFREVLELAEIFYHKKADEYENLIEAENGQMMNPAEVHEWNEEQKMQYSQENDERVAETANKDFETTKRLDEIVSEIKSLDFTLESKYETSLHSVALKNKDGTEIFNAKENDNIVIPVEHTIAAWANDEVSEKAKSLADEFFNLVCEDGIRGGDYVNAVFNKEAPVYEEDYETDLPESNISYTAENYYQVNDRFAIEIVPAESPLSSGKTGDDWTVRFYDINDSGKFGEKGQFVTSYYASAMLEHRKGTGLSLQGDVPAWTVDAETMDYVHDITFMWVDRHSTVQRKEDTEVSREEIEQEKAFVQKKIQQLKDELNNPENVGDEQQNSDVKENIENLERLTDEDIKKQILWKKENQKKNDETHSHVVGLMMEEKLRNETQQERELLSYNEKNPAYSVVNKETQRETSIQPIGSPAENVRKLGGLASLSEANSIIEKIKSSGFDILSTESRIIVFDKDKYYDFNSHSDSGYFNYETKKFEFDLDKRNLNEWDFREYIKNGLKITKRMKDFAKIEKQDFSKEQAATNFILEKLKTAGIEVITDKEEFDRILQREEFLQKMSKGQSPKYLNSEDVKMLKGWGYKTSEDLEQIQTAMLLSEIKLNGKKAGVKKAVEILGREKFLGGISRSAFHSTSANETAGNYVEFDSSVLFSDRSEDLEKLHTAEKESKEHISVLNEIARKDRYFQFNEEDTRKFIRKVDEWHKDNTNPRKLIVVGNIPPVMKVLGIAENLIEIEHSTLDKIVRENPLYPNDRQGHQLSVDDIYAIPSQLADPVMVFKSRTRKDSYVFFTERRDSSGNSILIPMAANKREGRIVINKITSMYGKDNEIGFVKTNIDEENLIYVDKKRSLEWINEKSFNGKLESQIQFLRQRLTDIETYDLNILTKERLVNFISAGQSQTLQKMSVSDGETYGFAYNGKIYLNPDVMNSNAAVHEYTHLWDSYTQRTNPELWQKGKDIFKNTHYWEEVENDPNYSDIANDDDLVLSEIHARICGDLSQKVLEHIAEIDGEITKDKAIDWNAETAAYVLDLYKKAQPENELIQNMDASEVKNDIFDFLSMPLKDLMAGKNISVSLAEKEKIAPNKPVSKSSQKKIREQCREILKKPDSEITEEDRKILAQYEGGGGLDENNRTNSEVLNAFYTPDNLIEKVWSLVDAYAPDAKTVLEPSAGVGKFANNRPNNKFTMHELDETSARVNKILHPEADVIQGAFQKQFLDDGERFLKIGYEQPKHDVVIGNPPYGKYNDKYKGLGEGREFDRYEEYFIARGLDALKDEKSVLAFVVPSGFLNTADDNQKKIIASKGEILDAYRLPEGTFTTTEVGTDILIMRKKESLDDRRNISSELLSNGEWFKNHPEKILGEVKTRKNRFGKEEEYVAVHEGLSVQDELNKIDSFIAEIKKTNQSEKLKDPLPEYSSAEEKPEVISSPEIFTDDFGENITDFKKSLEDKIYEKYIEANIQPVFSDQEGYARKIAQEISSALETKRGVDIGTIRSHLSMKNDNVSFEEKKLVKEIFEENTGLELPEFVNDHDAFDQQMNQVISDWEKSSIQKQEKVAPGSKNTEQIQKGLAEQSERKARNIVKSKGEVMSAEEFSHLYGRDFDEREFPIWKATDWQGNIDLSKLSGDDIQYLSESGKYVEKNIGEWTHKELFASGDIYAKIQEQRKLYANSDGNKIFADNIKLLESAMKSPLGIEKIHFGVKTALAENFKIEHIDAEGNKVKLNLQESFILWAQNANLADQKWRGDIDFATANISREELGEELSFYDIVNYIDGKPVKAEPVRGWRTYDMSEEEKAAEKAERRKEADLKRQERSDTANRLFDRYLHEGLSESDKKRLSAEYNRRFNSYVAPDYSKLPLFVDGMSAYKGDSKFKLYDQQIKGISFLCNKGNGILAYDVGVGKTAAGIVATVNQIQTGRSKRPLIVVPNQVYPKWYTDIRQLFPNVKMNDLYNFNSDFVSKYQDKKSPHRLNILENSISLCTYEALRNITFNDKSCENELYEDFASLLSADMDGNARENAESSDKIKGIIGSASHVKDSTYFFYEDCGFDNLTVDEAHNFKNLWVVPRPKKKGESNEYAGIPSGKPSARALKMYGMTQLTQRHNDDRNVFMLTATPFTNSPTEVYSMLSYVGRERLKQAGITSLRAFFDEFAQTKQELGVTSTGNIDTKQVMKSWKELSALQNILTEFIDKVDGEEAGIIRPNKFTHVKPLDMSDLQKEMREIDEERMADVKKGDSAAVIVAMNNMRLSCVAPALANPAMYPGIELPPLSKLVETSPKLKFVCDAIIDMYRGNPEKGQFMYVPLGKESHGIIKDYLIAHGIPKEAVEIINGEVNSTPEKKEKITSRFNDEKDRLKIIIGGKNTSEGIDLNGNSFVMYNCSLGWNPSETIQAEGRIWRQGNLQGNVHIVYPVMNDSIDSVLYQKHDEKRSRINELWNYKGDSLNVEDINPEDLKLDLIKDPHKKAKLILQEETKEARAELSRLNLKIKSFDEIIEKRKQLELDFSDAKETVDYQKKQIESYKESGLEVPEWIKSELKDCNKKFSKAETGLEKVNEKLSSLKITDSEKEAEYIHNLNTQKHACEEKINNIEKTLPQILKKLEIERMEQKLIEYPVEKQREILEADILNNLRPMKEVEYEIKTMRHESMLSEKLKAGEITESEFSLYKNAGYEKYEKWLNGEIESLEENSVKNESANENSSIENENDIEKIIVYYDGHWAEERGEKEKGWNYQEKSFDNPKDALDFYKTAKVPKDVGAETENGFRFNFMNPEEILLELISEHDKKESVQNENVSEKTTVEEPEQKDLKKSAEKTDSAKHDKQDMDSLYSDSGSLFFGFNDSDILSVHSPENEYRKTLPYDDFSITERQLTESELKRDEIIFPVLNGKESGMYKAFKDFAEHGVFDVQGKSVELDDFGRISGTGWNQFQSAMEIYRNKQFETFRYVLIDRENGEIKDQLAVKSYSPNRCAVSTSDLQTIKQVITRAEELDCMVAAVHNHPSGNTVESSFDAELTECLKRNLTKENGFCRFAGHIILDHDTFNLYTPENGWKIKLNSNAYGNSEDKLLNKNFAFLEDSVDYTWQLENVAKKINDRNNWNDNFIPVVFADSLNHVSGIKLYDKSFFDNDPQKIRNELQFSGLEANSVKAFPVITKNFAETMSAVDELLFEDKLKNLVEHSAFIDAALPESTVTEKLNILPGRQYFDVHGAKMKNPDIEATWQTRINSALFSEPEQRTMRKKEVAFER